MNNQIALLSQTPEFDTPFESQGRALQLRQLMNAGQAQDMEMQQKQQAMADDGVRRQAYLDNPEDGAARLRALTRAPAAYQVERKSQQDAQKAQDESGKTKAEARKLQIESAVKQLDAAGRALGFVQAHPTLENAHSTLDYLGRSGIYSMEDVAYYKEIVAKDPSQIAPLAEQAFRAALDAKDQIAKIDTRNTGATTDTLSVDPVTGKASVINSVRNTQSPDSVASNAQSDKNSRRTAAASAASTGVASERLKFDKEQAIGTQDVAMDPLAIRMTAQQYLAGDSSALGNFGRGAQGAKNLVKVREEVARMANAQGLNGSDIAAKMAEFGGMKAGQRTAGTRSASIEIAANEAAELAPLALDASQKVARSGLLPFGKMQIMFDSNTNNPELRQFAMANNALANAYGQVMSRGGVATVADKEHAKELLSTAFDQPSYAAAVQQLQAEIRAAQKAPKQVRKDMSNEIGGRHDGNASGAKFLGFE